VSLTTKRKVCDDEAEPLLEWARREGVELSHCSDCLSAETNPLVVPPPSDSEERQQPRPATATELTAFSWGYWGWGNTVPQFREAADAAEAVRGFEPPAFADVRFRRSVRAPGFDGSAFEKSVGPELYRWFNGLGNASIETGERKVRIANPADADRLLDYIIEQAAMSRRVLFFCSCRVEQELPCHRHEVASLLVQAARNRKVGLTVIEWPGGEPESREVRLTPTQWNGVTAKSVPLGNALPSAGLATLPWGSIVRLRSGAKVRDIVAGPARFEDQWRLVILDTPDSDAEGRGLETRAREFRDRYLCNARRT